MNMSLKGGHNKNKTVMAAAERGSPVCVCESNGCFALYRHQTALQWL